VGAGELDGVQAVDITRAANASIKGRGTITVQDTGRDIDWESVRLAPRYSTGTGAEWGIGHFVALAPVASWSDGQRSWSVEVLDVCRVLEKRRFTQTYTVTSGTNVATAIGEILALAGETRVSITDNGETLRSDKSWPVTEASYLTIINDLADAGNYFSLFIDPDGRFTLEPHILASNRTPVDEWLDGDESIHSGTFTVESNVDVPDQIIAIATGSGDDDALIGYAPDAGTYAYSVVVETDATSQAAITAYAARVLANAKAKRTTLVINHAPMPIAPNDVVRFRSTAAGLDGHFVVSSITEAATSLDLAQTTLRMVN